MRKYLRKSGRDLSAHLMHSTGRKKRTKLIVMKFK